MYRKQIILFRSVSGILLFWVVLVSASAVSDSTHVAVAKNDAIKSDTLPAIKKDSVFKINDILTNRDDTISHQVSTVKTAKENNPIPPPPVARNPVFKSPKKVREKTSQKFDPGKILVAVSRKVPSALHTPGLMVKKGIDFTRKNFLRVLLLLFFSTIIIATVLFFRQRVEVKRFMTTTRLSVMDKEVQKACRYIESNFDDPELTVDKLCTALVTGSAFLTALFERELGMSVEDFILQVRINRAKIMLKKENNAEIDIVAIKTGFTDIDQFRTMFVKLCGVSFDDYRKSQLTDQTTV
jgi:AraC-like DNA-binding protein